MLSVIASSAVDCEFEPRSDQNKDYQIGICCFFFMHKRAKTGLARNQDTVSELGDISIQGMLFQ